VSARALCSVLIAAIGLFFVVAAMVQLPMQWAMWSQTSLGGSGAESSDLRMGMMSFGFGAAWELAIGVALVGFRHRLANWIVPADDVPGFGARDEGARRRPDTRVPASPPAGPSATQLEAVGISLIGLYLVATGVPDLALTLLAATMEAGGGLPIESPSGLVGMTWLTEAIGIGIGLALIVWGRSRFR
jgi:hypothetical protein